MNASTIVEVDKNMVKMEEKAHYIATGFVKSTIKPKELQMDPIIKEVDPEMLNDSLVDVEVRIASE